MRVSTTQFEFSHGRKPKGTGLWLFSVKFADGDSAVFEFNGKFSDAKQAALAEARRLNRSSDPQQVWKDVVEVEVLP